MQEEERLAVRLHGVVITNSLYGVKREIFRKAGRFAFFPAFSALRSAARRATMSRMKRREIHITYWRDADGYVGRADEYPEYMTQGDTLEELEANIRSLVEDIEDPSLDIPGVRRHAVVEMA